MKADVSIIQKKSAKTNNVYNVILLTFDNGVEVECLDFNAVRNIQYIQSIIKSYGLD